MLPLPNSPGLAALGWNSTWEARRQALHHSALQAGRIAIEQKERYILLDGRTEHAAVVSGRFRHEARQPSDFPVVGDWVLFDPPVLPGPVVIEQMLPRQNTFSRQAAGGGSTGQLLASNIDTLLITSSCNADWNLHRLQRYVTLAHAGGVRPLVLLTKLDLIDDARPLVDLCRHNLGEEIPIVPISARTGEGLDKLQPYLAQGQTLALVGSSGVGKSTLVNRLTNSSLMEVRAIRSSDQRGVHTTTHRQLIRLTDGALLIDTPGMREVGMYDAGEGLTAVFADIDELAASCRFTDCQHDQEPGCAVQRALSSGDLSPERLEHYRKLVRENAYHALRENVYLQQQRKQQDRAVHRRQKDLYKHRKKR